MNTETNTASRPGVATPDNGVGRDTTLDRLETKIDRLVEHMEFVAARQRRLEELVDEGMPVARAAMRVGGQKLQDLDDKGYVTLGKALLSALDNVVEGYDEEDFRLLADNMVGILDVVRNFTQPEVLAIADQAAEALHDAGSVQPVSMLGAMRASREAEVQQGMAVMLQLMRAIGTASSTRKGGSERRKARTGLSKGMDSRLADRLAPTRRPLRTEDNDRRKPAAAPAAPPAAEAPVGGELAGLALDDQGFLADPATWNREFAELMAAAEGIELTDDAWKILEYARSAYQERGSSPNIRAITKGMGIETRAIYTAFPKAPGKTIARIAGIPKPVGCI